MDILILADFCGQLKKEDNNRFLYLADILCKNHLVEIVTSDFNHIKKNYFSRKSNGFEYKITMLHEPRYKKNICIKRFYSHYIWGKNVAKYLKKRKKPDVVYCAVPTLEASYEAAKYCEKNKIRFIVDVQDLWPEAFQMVFHVPVLSRILFFPFKMISNSIYKQADVICAVSKMYADRALSSNMKCKEGHVVFLGTDLSVFDKYSINKTDIKKDGLWLGYCGTLGSSYDLICVFDALEIVSKRIVPPRFIIMGDGPKKKQFEDYASSKGIKCSFLGRLPYDKMCAILKQCDIVVNPIMRNAAQSIINKHADYVASGLPIINTQECEEFRSLLVQYHMGINCENDNAEHVAEAIEYYCKNSVERINAGKNARRCAEDLFDRRSTYDELIDLILNQR